MVAADPLKLPALKPVPNVNAFVVVAETVPLEPRLIVVPLIVTDEFANWALLIVPLKSDVGIVEDAVMAEEPLPKTYPVRLFTPVPPLGTLSTPARTIDPVVGAKGVRPVDPALKDETAPPPPPPDPKVVQPPLA